MIERRQYDDGGAFVWGVLQIALGVFIGAMAAVFAYEAVLTWRVEIAASKVAAQAKEAQARSVERAARQREQDQQEQAQARQRRDAQAAAAQAERDRLRRKDQAWARYFTPSEPCRSDPSTVACANQYMAARKRFEAEYSDR